MNKTTIALLSILCTGMVQTVHPKKLSITIRQSDRTQQYEYAFSDDLRNNKGMKQLKYRPVKNNAKIEFDSQTQFLYVKPQGSDSPRSMNLKYENVAEAAQNSNDFILIQANGEPGLYGYLQGLQ